jgi:hypothetical protein
LHAKRCPHYGPEALITLLPALLSHLLPKLLKIGLSDREVTDSGEAKPNGEPGRWFPVIGKIWLLFYLSVKR